MSRCPFAIQQILPENNYQPNIEPRVIILHRAVSSAESLYNYWNSPGVNLESHFYVGQFGTIYQYMDTEVQADANVDANGFAISIESWDGGNTPDSMPWNNAQVQSIKVLLNWLCNEHGIPRVPCPAWNGSGIGGHNWYPYPWAGGPRGCPGTARNAQIRDDIIPWLANGGEEADMDDRQNRLLEYVAKAAASMWTYKYEKLGTNPNRPWGEDPLMYPDGGELGWVREQVSPVVVEKLQPVIDDLANVKSQQSATNNRVVELQGVVAEILRVVNNLASSGIPAVIDYPLVAKAVQDEEDLRNRDNDPTTGDPS